MGIGQQRFQQLHERPLVTGFSFLDGGDADGHSPVLSARRSKSPGGFRWSSGTPFEHQATTDAISNGGTGSPNGTLFELVGRTRSTRQASASASTTGRRERVDYIHICVSAEPDVAAVDAPYAVLPHQRNEMSVGHVVSASLVAARLTEQLPESVRLAWCAHVRPLEKGFRVGGCVACAERLREDRGVRNDAQVTQYNRPEQIKEVGSTARRTTS